MGFFFPFFLLKESTRLKNKKKMEHNTAGRLENISVLRHIILPYLNPVLTRTPKSDRQDKLNFPEKGWGNIKEKKRSDYRKISTGLIVNKDQRRTKYKQEKWKEPF